MDAARAVYLTELGETIAKEIYERHVTICTLLTELGVEAETAATDACRMEHAMSRESFEALKALLKKRSGENSDNEEF